MPTYLISYDLNKPPQNADYHPLIKRIRDDWKGERVLFSEWFVRTTATAVALRDDLRQYIDPNDGLIVLGLTGEAAWTGTTLQLTDDQVKRQLAA